MKKKIAKSCKFSGKVELLSQKALLSSNLLRNLSCFLVKADSNLRKLRFLRFLLRKKAQKRALPAIVRFLLNASMPRKLRSAPLSSSLILTADWRSPPTHPKIISYIYFKRSLNHFKIFVELINFIK